MCMYEYNGQSIWCAGICVLIYATSTHKQFCVPVVNASNAETQQHFVVIIKTIESSLLYMPLSRRQQIYRMSCDGKT